MNSKVVHISTFNFNFILKYICVYLYLFHAFKKIFFNLFLCIWLYWVLVVALRIFSLH